MTTRDKIIAVGIRYNRRAGEPGSHIYVYDVALLKLKSISSINIGSRTICMDNGGMYPNVEPDDLEKVISFFDDLLDY